MLGCDYFCMKCLGTGFDLEELFPHAEVVARTDMMTEEQWLQLRLSGIGGSDASGLIRGLSKYKTPITVYMEKAEGYVPELKNVMPAKIGKLLEPIVAELFEESTGHKTYHLPVMLRSKYWPWMIANLDYIYVDEIGNVGILECKTATDFLNDAWVDNKAPEAYQVQVYHYMAVTGIHADSRIACLVGNRAFYTPIIPFDKAMVDALIKIEHDFWNEHVTVKNPPEMDGSDAATDLVKALYGISDDGTTINLSDESVELRNRYVDAHKQVKALEYTMQECKNKLATQIQSAEVAFLPDGSKVTYKTNSKGTRVMRVC
jgi:putative phage-type endonuclease